MKIINGIVVIVSILILSAASWATEAHQFELRASRSFDKAIDIAAVNDRIFVLSTGTLTVLDASTLTPTLERIRSFAISRDLVHVAAYGKTVVLASRHNFVEVYQMNGLDLIHRSSFHSADSIVNMAVVDNTLHLAQGFGGVQVLDLSDLQHPRTQQLLIEPAYALDVDAAGNFLFVLDALNGVTVFAKSSGQFQNFDEILSNMTPADISAFENGVVVSYGSQRSEVWYCTAADGAQLERVVETEFDVTPIAVKRSSDENLYVASETGNIAIAGSVIAQASYPYPIVKICAFENSLLYSFVALDRFGKITAFKNGPNLDSRATYENAAIPTAFVAASEALYLSTSKGIQEVSSSDGAFELQTILPGAPITPILAAFGPFLFAGSSVDGKITIYENQRGRWQAHSQIATGLALKRNFVFGSLPDHISLVAIGEDGISRYRLETNGTFFQVSSLAPDGLISNADICGNWLAITFQQGRLDLYSVHGGTLTLAGTTRCVGSPRDVEVTLEGVVAISHSSGIQVLEFDRTSGGFTEHRTPAAIASAFDLHYDELSRELIIAGGSTPAKYLDFADPSQLGTVYLIPGTERTGEIAYRDSQLYCLSSDWIRFYDRVAPTSPGRENATLRSVSAAPNPFNATTQMTIELSPTASLPLNLEISFVNILGQILYRKDLTITSNTMTLPLPQVIGEEPPIASGVYFFVVRAAGELVSRKLVLLK